MQTALAKFSFSLTKVFINWPKMRKKMCIFKMIYCITLINIDWESTTSPNKVDFHSFVREGSSEILPVVDTVSHLDTQIIIVHENYFEPNFV